MMDSGKPTEGLQPKWRHDLCRMAEVLEAIARHVKIHDRGLPDEWINEAIMLLSAEKRRLSDPPERVSRMFRDSPQEEATSAAVSAGQALKSAAEAIRACSERSKGRGT